MIDIDAVTYTNLINILYVEPMIITYASEADVESNKRANHMPNLISMTQDNVSFSNDDLFG